VSLWNLYIPHFSSFHSFTENWTKKPKLRFFAIFPSKKKWPEKERDSPSESTWAPPTPASESGSTTASKSSPTIRATVPHPLMSPSPIPKDSSEMPLRTRSPWTPSTPSSVILLSPHYLLNNIFTYIFLTSFLHFIVMFYVLLFSLFSFIRKYCFVSFVRNGLEHATSPRTFRQTPGQPYISF